MTGQELIDFIKRNMAEDTEFIVKVENEPTSKPINKDDIDVYPTEVILWV